MIRKIRKWMKRDEGVVAIEFALLALPLYTMIMGIIEVAMFFTAGSVLEGASATAARLIRTGQVQTANDPESFFEEELCDNAVVILDCSKLKYEVIHVDPNTFSDAEEYQSQFDADGNLIPGPFNPGNSNDVIIVRVSYNYEFLTPFIGAMITGDPSKNSLTHVATVVMKSEPYDFGED